MAPLQIPGFTPLSDQVFERKSGLTTTPNPDHPNAVIIFGWGDGLPKHVLKYADGYQALFPHTDLIVVLSPILKAIWSDLPDRSNAMGVVVDAIFGSEPHQDSKILLHTMSNAGGINCAATLHRYREQFGQPMPHQLLVLDSTPGTPYFTFATMKKWSRAMALGTASYFPWPFFITQGIWAVFLAAHRLLENVIGRESASIFSSVAINSEEFSDKAAQRLYLYSKEDDLIGWDDIEKHAAEAKEKGYDTDGYMFEGSGHVGHMRMFPEKYWSSIQQAWKDAIASE